jgi:hypothetical protein
MGTPISVLAQPSWEKQKKDMFHVLGLSKVGEHPELAESPS